MYLGGPPWLVLYVSKKFVTTGLTNRIIRQEKGTTLDFEKKEAKISQEYSDETLILRRNFFQMP